MHPASFSAIKAIYHTVNSAVRHRRNSSVTLTIAQHSDKAVQAPLVLVVKSVSNSEPPDTSEPAHVQEAKTY